MGEERRGKNSRNGRGDKEGVERSRRKKKKTRRRMERKRRKEAGK